MSVSETEQLDEFLHEYWRRVRLFPRPSVHRGRGLVVPGAIFQTARLRQTLEHVAIVTSRRSASSEHSHRLVKCAGCDRKYDIAYRAATGFWCPTCHPKLFFPEALTADAPLYRRGVSAESIADAVGYRQLSEGQLFSASEEDFQADEFEPPLERSDRYFRED